MTNIRENKLPMEVLELRMSQFLSSVLKGLREGRCSKEKAISYFDKAHGFICRNFDGEDRDRLVRVYITNPLILIR